MIPDANLGWLFTEVDWPDRFAAAASAGFTAVEMPWPPLPPQQVADALTGHGLTSVLVNVPVGSGEFGFGWACRPDHLATFRETFAQALAYADLTATRFIHVLAGLCPPGLDHDLARDTYRTNLVWALDQLGPDGPTLLVEAINRRDNPHFLLADLADAADLVASLDHPRVRLLFDTFHCGVEGLRTGQHPTRTVADRFAEVRDLVGHIQLGDAPERTAPGTGVIDFAAFFEVLCEADWSGFIGGEYRPDVDTVASLNWRGQLTAPGGDLRRSAHSATGGIT